MSNDYDDELPVTCLPGAQPKFEADLVDGQYVARPALGPLRIARWPVFVRDPRPLREFVSVDGPPSIVDVIIAKR